MTQTNFRFLWYLLDVALFYCLFMLPVKLKIFPSNDLFYFPHIFPFICLYTHTTQHLISYHMFIEIIIHIYVHPFPRPFSYELRKKSKIWTTFSFLVKIFSNIHLICWHKKKCHMYHKSILSIVHYQTPGIDGEKMLFTYGLSEIITFLSQFSHCEFMCACITLKIH